MSEKQIRLLVCKTCKTVDPLPWYEGNPDYDFTLAARVAEHQFPNGTPHVAAGLATIDEKHWEHKETRRQIVERISEATGGGETGLGSDFYSVKSTFQEDAFACWKAHNRTTNCDEYRSDKKRLLPDTKAERKELGVDVNRRPGISLCEFCPMESIVAQRKRKKKGAY